MRIAEEAESLLLYQFNQAERLKGLMRSLVSPLQKLVDDLETAKLGMHLDDVTESWLDILGHVVGQSRTGMSDADMRTMIKIRILLNRCSGKESELLDALSLLLGPDHRVTVSEHEPNDIVHVFFSALTVLPQEVFSLIKKVAPLGLRHHFVNADNERPFQLDKTAFSSSCFAEFFPRELSHE